jgi:acyl carrier protein
VTRDELQALFLRELGEAVPGADLAGLAPRDDLRERLDMDSLDFLNLVVRLHKSLALDIPETDYARLRTLEGALDYLSGRVAARSPP